MIYKRLRTVVKSQRSFDHLVGARKQRCRYGKAKGFRGLKIYHQFNFGALLDRGSAGLARLRIFPAYIPCC